MGQKMEFAVIESSFSNNYKELTKQQREDGDTYI